MHASFIDMQGPRVLWYILKILTSHNTLVLKEFQTELANLGEYLVEKNFDLIKIAPELHQKILDYKEAGGPTFTIYDQVISALRTIPCQPFVQELQLYEVDQKAYLKQTGQKDASVDPLDLLQKIPEMIKMLDATNQWPYHMGGKPCGGNKRKQSGKDSNNKKKAKEDDPDDITAFRAEMKSMSKKLTALQANQSGTAAPSPPPKTKADSKFKLTKHFGPSCYYKTREDLEQFISGNLGKDIVEMPAGTIWF